MVTARCPDCGFDPQEWNDQDRDRTLARADHLLRHAFAGLPGIGSAGSAPAPGSPSGDAAVHDLLHRCWEAAERLADLDAGRTVLHGTVARVNRSDGGVPKTAVAEAVVGRRGLAGDRQASRRHHGRPWQALCLWSADVIDALVAEGHPVGPGCTGENLTLRGVDWARLRSGLVLAIGPVRCRLSVPAEPCRNIDGCFSGTSSRRIDHDRHPGWSRWYATVLDGGTVRAGDPAVVTAR